MVYRILAVFNPGTSSTILIGYTARPPAGLEHLYHKHMHSYHSPDDVEALESRCRASLERFPSQVLMGGGNGWALEASTYCHYAEANGVHALLAGEVSEWPGVDVVAANHDAFVRGEAEPAENENDAAWLLRFYNTFLADANAYDVIQAALGALARLRGNFAFVLYDAVLRRVLASRDRDAVQPLYWGVTADERFMIGSQVEDLTDCDPSATLFPAGALFIGESAGHAESPGPTGWVIPGDAAPGRLLSFMERSTHAVSINDPHWRAVKAVPRVNSRGMICGAVYRVASDRNIIGGNSVF